VSTSLSEAWVEAAPLMAELQRATEGGGVLVVKVDNERDTNVFTLVISGSKFGGRFFRQDGSDLMAILRNALAFCAEGTRKN